MNRTRPLDAKRRVGMGFITIVVALMAYLYFGYVFVILWSRLDSKFVWALLVVFNLVFIGLIASFYQCVMTDPGLVPANWGFYMGDETKRRRYCKMCNVWKPDRTHHCSICNRCVLNMDHHCPWINNCVGFYNRKFFMQLLFYTYATLAIVTLTGLFDLSSIIFRLFLHQRDLKTDDFIPQITSWTVGRFGTYVIMTIEYNLVILLITTLTTFVGFHLNLMNSNYTTIENLERDASRSRYDIGKRRNWEQVFGSNPLWWWLPMHSASSRPAGDGVRWRVHYTRVIEEEDDGQDPATRTQKR
eukprot:GHVL01024932.1.p1 GENE.GHVL01024932.1~~GHVL01024932.1.p1  ORF type:complete len:301 (+),score=4.39 GHVL01024932.1:103-1005(+)